MTPLPTAGNGLAGSARKLAHDLLEIGQTRWNLLATELEEERLRWLGVLGLCLAIMVCSLLAGIALGVAFLIAFWARAPVLASLALGVIYVLAGLGFYWKLRKTVRQWTALPETRQQLRKDRECLIDLLASPPPRPASNS